ncbi:MAG: hypothetical protein EOM55_01570 [Clostridia bacterium]|nr:hypothetical protein [Clostridia bacterium]
MNLFENKKYYNKDEFDKLSYEIQKELFLKIRMWVPDVDEETKYNKDKYKKVIIKKIEEICAYACSGHIPSQDYMGYIYKRGFDDFFPINYKRSIEWNIISASNLSKIAPQKMKAFMNPAVDMIIYSPRWSQIIRYNDLNLSNYFWFLSQYVCDILYKELSLNPVEMAKKELIEEDTNERRARIFFDRFRDRSVEQAIEVLEKQLPENMEEVEEEGVGEDLLKDEKGNKKGADDIFVDPDIEDI